MSAPVLLAGMLLAAAGPPAAAPGCLRLETPEVRILMVRDPDDGSYCGGEARLVFSSCREERLTLAVGQAPVVASLDGAAPRELAEVALTAGRHTITLSGEVLGRDPSAWKAFTLSAGAEGSPERASGVLAGDVANPAVLDVGRTLVVGVDLFDGHLVMQASDLKLEGRHLALELKRSYSSAGRGGRSRMGAGWSFSYDAHITVAPDCGLYAVTRGDGASTTFRSRDAGRSFTSQRGYHTRLVRAAGGGLDFIDKAGVRHHFEPTPGDRSVLRLAYSQEPHGDRVSLRYDAQGRLVEAAEDQRVDATVRLIARKLAFDYARVAGFDRVRRVRAVDEGLEAEFDYDARGNLVATRRRDEEASGVAAERYEYAAADERDPHHLVAVTDAEGTRTEYRFAERGTPFPGAGAAGSPSRGLGPREFVVEAAELPAVARRKQVTRFFFDHSQAGAGRFRVRVQQADGSTHYVLDRDGFVLTVDSPGARGSRDVTRTRWAQDDVYKLHEEDNHGLVADWQYDARGNLVREVLRQKAGAPEEVSVYAYDPAFNQLTLKVEPNGRTTRWEFDPTTGDLLAMVAPDGATTRYEYDDLGRLTSKREPSGALTRYGAHDSLGYATIVVAPDGSLTRHEYDVRGRRITPAAPAK